MYYAPDFRRWRVDFNGGVHHCVGEGAVMVTLAWRISILWLGVGTRDSIRRYTGFGTSSVSLH